MNRTSDARGSSDPLIGTHIGRYVLREQLASGGMGAIYVAVHERLENTKKAVKVLLGEHAKNEGIRTRFEREATAVSKLRHKHIITIDDFGALADGTPFLMMPFLEGKPLDEYIRAHGRFTTHRTLHIVVQICSALQHAHQLGIVHRDLKPGNIFITASDDNPYHVTLIDLGIARDLSELDGKTHTGMSVGTPGYMAVEQYGTAADASPLADVYALAIVMWEMLTGDLPWGRQDPRVLYFRQMTERPAPLPAGSMPAEWETILRSALEVKLADRPQSMRALAVALASVTPAIPPHVPSGADMLASLAKDLVEKAPPSVETVRNSSGQDLAPRMWPPRETQIPAVTTGETVRRSAQAGPDDLLETARSTKPTSLIDVVHAPAGRTEPGAVVARYRLGAKLGAGGMAEVFAATAVGAEGFERPVAIKRVLAGYSNQPAFAAMFVEEARIASRLGHPNIVGVFDFDRDPEGRLFLAMELVDGMDLATLIASGEMPVGVAIFIASEILRGLGFAHDLHDPVSGLRGVIHRDVAPHNVLLSWEGAVKVSDFGLAKVLDADGSATTRAVKGHLAYMSPEQANGEALDPRADLFSLGVVLYELLTGRPLFQGDPSGVVAQVFFQTIVPPRMVRPEIPAELDAVVMMLLARDRNVRFATAEAAILALARCADAPTNGRSDLARLIAGRFPRAAREHAGRPPERREAEHFAAARPPSTLSGETRSPIATPNRRRRILVGIASGLVIGGIVGAVVVVRSRASHATSVADANAGDISPSDASTLAAVPVDAGRQPDVEAAVVHDAASVRPVRVDASFVDASTSPHAPDSNVAGHAKPAEAGSLAIYVKPWAQIWLNDRSAGPTPYTAALPAGRYRVRLANEDLGKDETTTVVVQPNKTTTLERKW